MTTLAKLLGMGGGGSPELWTATRTVQQREYVTSPTDDEIYQRKTATGTSATDPLYDTTNYRAVSYEREMPSVNAWSASGAAWTSVASADNAPSMGNGVSSSVINSLAVNARTLLLSGTGKGVLEFAGIIKAGGSAAPTVRVRLEVILDGRVLYDYDTIPSYIAGTSWMLLLGRTNGGVAATIQSAEARFSTGFQIYVTVLTATQSACTFYSAWRGLES